MTHELSHQTLVLTCLRGVVVEGRSSEGVGGGGGCDGPGVILSCDCTLLPAGLWLRVPRLQITHYSARADGRRGRGLRVTLVHYYRIIILGGELLILLVTAHAAVPPPTPFASPGDETQDRTCRHMLIGCPPQAPPALFCFVFFQTCSTSNKKKSVFGGCWKHRAESAVL